MANPLPVSGAWHPAHGPGHRQFLLFPHDRPFALDGGVVLRDVTVAYETWGELNADASNAVLVCHAWTGDSHVAGPSGRGHAAAGWWDAIVGPGKAIDTDRWFVVCANVLGGCQGSTGPASPHPLDGRPYGSRFPVVTIRDMVRAQARLATHLGVDVWHAVIGGSMGGMQVLEWALTFPQRVRSIVPIATCAQAAQDGGADAVSLINTLLGMAVDIRTRRPTLANVVGGLSGPAIKPVALRCVHQVCRKVIIPVIGIGGIVSAEDALEFILLGAAAVQVGTANFLRPDQSFRIIDDLPRAMIKARSDSLSELRGSFKLP